jgi:hypothetical protein
MKAITFIWPPHFVYSSGSTSKTRLMSMPVQEFAVGLDGRDHAGQHAGTIAQRWQPSAGIAPQ